MFITNYKIKDSVYCLYKVRSKIYKKKAPDCGKSMATWIKGEGYGRETKMHSVDVHQ